MTTRQIKTIHDHDVCDVCGRTLLRGESLEGFVDGPHRHSVCELCKPHALHEGWVREGTIPDFRDGDPRQARRRSLLGRFRGRGVPATAERGSGYGGLDDEEPIVPQTLDDELSMGDWPETERGPIVREPAAIPEPAPARPARERRERPREPRQVHAVPTGDRQKIAAAVNSFNRTEYTRTLASVSRSLGEPSINITPDAERPGLVRIVATWELCWYRYEVELGNGSGGVRLDSQGYELDELSPDELEQNAFVDESGRLYYE